MPRPATEKGSQKEEEAEDAPQEPVLRIRGAGAKGKGVFAARRVEPGDLVWDYQGEERRGKDIPKQVWRHCFQVDHDRYVVPERWSVGWFMNHSCVPNCVIMGRTRVVALRRIEPGEEVTFDYSTDVSRDGFSMKCRCGMTECRKTVRSYSFLPDELKGHYGACVSGFLLRPVASSSEGRR